MVVTLLTGYHIFVMAVEIKIQPDVCEYEPFLNVIASDSKTCHDR